MQKRMTDCLHQLCGMCTHYQRHLPPPEENPMVSVRSNIVTCHLHLTTHTYTVLILQLNTRFFYKNGENFRNV